MDANPKESRWLVFREAAANPKTKRWAVANKCTGMVLGIISWYAPWRRYAFSPYDGTVFECDCLRDVADFCETQTRLHKEQRSSTHEH